ncbi:MAG: zinc ribbon domain-containing protein [Desulfovibrionaceae bacterium]
MPIHEYHCKACGKRFEEIVQSDEKNPRCPLCGGAQTKRMLSAPSALSGKEKRRTPDATGHGCCGSRPGDRGCIPGSCCGGGGIN